MADHLPHPPQQRLPFLGLVLGVIAVVAAVVGIYFSRADLGDKLNVAEHQVNELRYELECRSNLAAEVDVVRLDNEIAYDNYVLALGDDNADLIPVARAEIVKARDAMIAVREQRDKTTDLCR